MGIPHFVETHFVEKQKLSKNKWVSLRQKRQWGVLVRGRNVSDLKINYIWRCDFNLSFTKWNSTFWFPINIILSGMKSLPLTIFKSIGMVCLLDEHFIIVFFLFSVDNFHINFWNNNWMCLFGSFFILTLLVRVSL